MRRRTSGRSVPKLEAGEVLPYPLMRELGADVRHPRHGHARSFAKMQRGQADGDGAKRSAARGPGEGPLMAILMMELSRFCPGFALAFGASLGLCGGAILSRGDAASRRSASPCR